MPPLPGIREIEYSGLRPVVCKVQESALDGGYGSFVALSWTNSIYERVSNNHKRNGPRKNLQPRIDPGREYHQHEDGHPNAYEESDPDTRPSHEHSVTDCPL